ncbi:MAG TPA: SRPBCC family protein [Methylocystis sp.]|nr:SRPBCC family protein [Methylocystis sp.]
MVGVALVLLYFGLALLAAVIIMQPDRFVVTRDALIAAPPERVFNLIAELRNWEDWSPWVELDPKARRSYFGPPGGPGAGFEWSGNSKVGAGRLTVAASRPNEAIDIKLDFLRPLKASNDVSFRLAPEGAGTRVSWAMVGRNTLVSKALNLIRSRDKTIGGQFEQGLANLNRLASVAPAA